MFCSASEKPNPDIYAAFCDGGNNNGVGKRTTMGKMFLLFRIFVGELRVKKTEKRKWRKNPI